jgi:hypothetical protein
MNSWVDLHALWRIVLIGLICGAGLPALFAVGLRALSIGPPTNAAVADGGPTPAPAAARPLGIGVAAVCFAVVLAAIGWGIYLIVAGS